MIDECIVPSEIAKDKDGYPRFKWNKRTWRMNRWMWTIVHGAIPEGLVVAHRCNNPGCINANHLYLCTKEQNSSDAARDGLYASGEKNGRFKATPEVIVEILRRYHDENESQQSISKAVGISQSQISHLIRTNDNLHSISSRTAHPTQNL